MSVIEFFTICQYWWILIGGIILLISEFQEPLKTKAFSTKFLTYVVCICLWPFILIDVIQYNIKK